MSSSKTPITNIRGSNNQVNTNPSVVPSRLLNSTNGIRNDLMSRNLYTPNRIYPITEKTNAQNVINAIGGIASIVAPYKSFNLKNTVYGRLLNPAESTPLTEIGLAMLGNQFALNSMSYISKNNLPSIKVANLFDGSKNTKLFTRNKNFKITKKEDITSFQQFIDNAVYYYPARDYPFTKDAVNSDYVRNTGTGQLVSLFQAINQNVYKQGFSVSTNYFGISSYNDITLTNNATEAEMPLIDRKTLIGDYYYPKLGYRKYFNFFRENPYSNIWPFYTESIEDANGSMVIGLNPSLELLNSPTQEYAPTQTYVDNMFGVANTNDYDGDYLSENSNEWINTASEFNDDIESKLIWGRDGVSQIANDEINYLRGSFNSVNTATVPSSVNKFKIHSGLLEYTRNLLNASEGAVVDITRKAFTKKKNIIGFNGSAVWVSNGSTYANKSGFETKSGVRQHSMLDQYDKFAKAIRYEGNYVYQGNEDSVINSTVMPRIHPTLDEKGKANNKNLMFSIENLAILVRGGNDGTNSFGYIDDEYGSAIPACEVGPFQGRIMWFPPYNMQITETSSPKYDQVSMVGRNEPMYSYMNTERTASLTFTLLVDYPPNLKNYRGSESEKHRIISEFFAFGGDVYNPPSPPNNPDKTIKEKENEKEIIENTNTPPEPNTIVRPAVRIHFPDSYPPVKENLQTVVDTLYLVKQYQILPNCAQSSVYEFTKDNNTFISFGLNSKIFVKEGIDNADVTVSAVYYYLNTSLLPNNFSQYTAVNADGCELNQYLHDIFDDEVNRPLYTIDIIGAASTLGGTEYNLALGQRRADVAKYLVEAKLKAMFGKTVDELGIKITTKSIGESKSNELNSAGTTPEERRQQFEKEPTIRERYAEIQINRNQSVVKTETSKSSTITVNDSKDVENLNNDIKGVDRAANQNSNSAANCVYNERGKDTGAILDSFKSVSGNYYQPVFHSQTPEDFHKRLTFLQQCTRQGNSKKFNALTPNNSVFGRQPICILRIGDFYYTKVIIDNLQIDYADTTWDMNPEGFGMQPMIAKVTLGLKVLGGQSLKGPIDALQNAVSFNYYANSSYTSEGLYYRPSKEADKQAEYIDNIRTTQKDKIANTTADVVKNEGQSGVNSSNNTTSGGININEIKFVPPAILD